MLAIPMRTTVRRLNRFGLDGGQADIQVHWALRRGSAIFYSRSPALERSHFVPALDNSPPIAILSPRKYLITNESKRNRRGTQPQRGRDRFIPQLSLMTPPTREL